MVKSLIFWGFLASHLVSSEPVRINLVTTNDIHGVLASQTANFMNPNYPPTIVGAAAFSKYVDELRISAEQNGEGLLILDGGNFFQGNPLGTVDGGRTMIQWMNRIGYHALVPGSYDFILGAEVLNNAASTASFPFLFANLECHNCPLIHENIKPYSIMEISGINIGLLGIVNSRLTELVLAENLEGTTASLEVPAVNRWVPQMKSEGAEVIIILNSSGVPWDREEEYATFLNKVKEGEINENHPLNALELGYFLEDVDFLVAGGNSKGYPLPWYDPHSHVFVMQGYGGGTEFSHIQLLIDRDSHTFNGYETVVDGRASQTLLADDFQVKRKDAAWIQEKQDMAMKQYYSDGMNHALTSSHIKKLHREDWNIPSINQEHNLDIISWNVEFFPHANDSTILSLAEAVLDLDADIIAFQEIRKTGWFSKLMAYLPEYAFVVSTQASFMDLATIYKKDQFELIRHIEPFADNDYNFAGRPPLQTDLRYFSDRMERTLRVVNLHMKCCDSGLERRKKAAGMLHEYLSDRHDEFPNVIVLGDWNDDTKDAPGQHCFDPFFEDERFYFTTEGIAYDISQATYPKEPYVSFLDHIMVSETLLPTHSDYIVKTLIMGNYMGGYDIYEAYISDHRPVLLSFPLQVEIR